MAHPKKNTQADIVNPVAERVRSLMESGELNMPRNYSPENAMKSAYLILQETKDMQKRPVLEVCSKASIQNALLKMVVMGLSPLKQQCAFIARGEKLICQPQYQGNIIRAKRQAALKEHYANAIHSGDVFEYHVEPHTGRKIIDKHEQSLETLDNEVIGAYVTLFFADGKRPYTDIMTIKQIRQSWMQGDSKGDSPAHKKFPYTMAEKTVINRAVKLYIEGSDDDDVLPESREPEKYAVTEGAKPLRSDAELVDIDDTQAQIPAPAANAPEPEQEPEPEPQDTAQPAAEPTIFGEVGDPPPPPKSNGRKGKKAPF